MNSQIMNCVMIAPEGANAKMLRDAVAGSFTYEMTAWLKEFPDDNGLVRMLRLNAPDLLVVDFSDVPKALRSVSVIQNNAPHTQIMALCEENVSVLSTLLRAGVRDYVTPSSTFEDVVNTLKALYSSLAMRPETPRSGGNIISFLPAKPGSGASTIAANVAFAASKNAAKRTLLADFDRNSGVLSFLFKLRAEHTLRDALNNMDGMDPDVWSRIRSQVGELDILPSDMDAAGPVDGNRATHLINFFRRAYDLSCLDLSGQIDNFSIEALLESKKIYLVCTQELACQHLLLRKVERLRRSGIDKQMRLIINRFLPRHIMTPDRISDLVGVPVELTVANDYEAANCSMENGDLVKLDTQLGRSYRQLAEVLLDDRIAIPKSKPRFLEFFSQPFVRSSAQSA